MLLRRAPVGFLWVLSACSTVPYQTQFGTFANATTDMISGDKQVLSGERADQQRLFFMQMRAGMVMAPTPAAACIADKPYDKPCIYLANSPGTNAPSAMLSPTPALNATEQTSYFGEIPPVCLATNESRDLAQANPLDIYRVTILPAEDKSPITESAILGALTRYADALKAISSANDRAAMEQATTKLATAVSAVVGAVGLAAGGIGAAAGPAAGAAVKLGGTVLTAVEEQRRLEALRSNLITACVPVRTLAIAAGLLTRAHRDYRRNTNDLTMSIPRNRNLPKKFDMTAAYTQGWAAADSSQTLSVDPLQVARGMVMANNALVEAVASGRLHSFPVTEVVDKFAQAAKALLNSQSSAGIKEKGTPASDKTNPS